MPNIVRTADLLTQRMVDVFKPYSLSYAVVIGIRHREKRIVRS